MTIQSSVYRWYRQGTVAVTNGSTAVTGTTTAWSTNVKAGDGFSLDGATWYEVASVTDNTHLVLASNFGGSTTSGASYAIDRRSLAWQVGSEAAARVLALQQMLQQTLKTTGQPPDTIGSDGAVAYDATAMVFYTNTGGTWDTGTSFRGATVLNGAGAPSSGTGSNADFYLDTTNTRLYGPKTGGAWGSYVSLVGPTGATGSTGATGATGPANSLSIGTVTTGAAGSSASATITGTAPTQTLSLTIPRGDTGASGSGSGNVTGPASSVIGHVALFDNTSGTLLKDGPSVATSTTAGRLARYSNTTGSQAQTTGLFEDGSGLIGAGTASPWDRLCLPFNEKLSFGQSASYKTNIYRISSGDLDTYFDSVDDLSASYIRFRMRTGGTPVNVLTLTGAGYCGFNTASPWAAGSVPFNNKISFGSSSYSFNVYKSSAGSLDVYFDSADNDVTTKVRFRMRTSGTPVDLVTLTGDSVGVNTSSPSTTLHVSGPIRCGSYTVGTLPSAATVGAGTIAYVTDATSTTYHATVSGGGSNKVQVLSDGTNWLIS